MKKFALAAFASVAALSLSACGRSDDPNAQASADTADMPAEESVSSAEANALPVADSSDSADGKTTSDTKAAAEQTAKDFEDMGGDTPAKAAEPAAPKGN